MDWEASDRAIYERELEDFLPLRLFDAHVHLLDASCLRPDQPWPAKSLYRKFGGTFPLEAYREWTRLYLPGQEITVAGFGHPGAEIDREACAAYWGRLTDRKHIYGLALAAPDEPIDTIIRRVEDHRLVGLKPYPGWVQGKTAAEVELHEMLSSDQWAYADARGLILMLHLPRTGRLIDAVNQVQMVEACRRYPRARLIFAHVGRAYFLRAVVGGLEGIAACTNAYVDTSMVNHEGVLEYLFQRFPRDRILFGSDAPVAMLRGKSVEINDQYAYILGEDYEVGTSIYDARHAVRFTFFYYEQLRAIRRAAERVGLRRHEVEAIFYGNAAQLFGSVASTL